MYLAENLKYLREKNRETQKDISKLLSVIGYGFSEMSVSRYESGECEPELKKVILLAEHFNVAIDELLTVDLKNVKPLYLLNLRFLRKYISEELLPWAKRFPDEFYKQMFRLKGWDYKGKAKPGYAGTLTNEYIYKYLPCGVLDELRKKTPKSTAGNKINRYHQHLSEKTGIAHLDKHLQQTIALMKASDNWEEFDKLFHKAMGEPVQMELDINNKQ